LRRFLVDKIQAGQRQHSVTGQEARHISTVLRMGPGDRLILMDGEGARFLASVVSSNPREVLVKLEKPLPIPPPSPVDIHLCQAVLKSRAMDYLIQKTSELGVHSILPFYSDRSVIRLDSGMLPNKLRHWREIAGSSAKQSDRLIPAKIEPIHPFGQLMSRWQGENALKVVLWEDEGSKDLKGLLRGSPVGRALVGMVGPEGGFTREEVLAAQRAGFVPVSVGNRILRSETAAISLVAIIQYEWGDLGLPHSRVPDG
jgi:16S rRNA (uracil1498-N3)-methyltransferase